MGKAANNSQSSEDCPLKFRFELTGKILAWLDTVTGISDAMGLKFVHKYGMF